MKSLKYVDTRTDPFPFIADQLNFEESSNQTTLQTGATYSFTLSSTDDYGISVSSLVGNARENAGVPPNGGVQTGVNYDPTRKVCLASSSVGVLEFPAPDGNSTFSGVAFGGSGGHSYCAPWGTTIVSTELANSPATTIAAKYSADAMLPVLTDPLSTASGSWTLGAYSAPTLISISPSSASVGSPDLTLRLTGSSFVPASVVSFNGDTLATTFVDVGTLTATPPASELLASGTFPITVSNPGAGVPNSNLLPFTVSGVLNPVPAISSLSPGSLLSGSVPQSLTINGTGFLASSTVTFDGISHAPTFISVNQLTILLSSADLATVGTFPVVVANPAPGGGASSAANFTVNNSVQASGMWTWMGGSNTRDHLGVYGTLGAPAPGNIPGSRSGAVSWTDSNGHLWIFGGSDSNGALLDDLWQFDPSMNEWAWMGGSSTANRPGQYGTLGTPAPGNIPGGRSFANSWTDSSGNLWLFGGEGFDANGYAGDLNDLWRYQPPVAKT